MKGVGNFFSKTLVGGVVLTLIPINICGSTVPLSVILLMLAIASAGLGLVIVIPLFWLVGTGTVALGSRLFGSRTPAQPAPRAGLQPVQGAPNNYFESLVNYIRMAKEIGLSDEAIRRQCTRNGASEEEIRRAFEQLRARS